MGSTYLGKPIGLQNVTFFPLTSDNPGEEAVYGAPIKVGRAIKANLTPALASAILESEDGVEDDLSILTGYGVTIDVSQINDVTRAAIFGHTIDNDGGLVITRGSQPVKGALAFKTRLSTAGGAGEKFMYNVLYVGRFKEFAENFETLKQGNITFQTHPGVEGTFTSRDSDGRIRYTMREDQDDFNKAKAEAWFTAVQEPTFPSGGDGRNLLLGSNVPISSSSTGLVGYYTMTEDMEATKYTLTIKGELGEGRTTFIAFLNGYGGDGEQLQLVNPILPVGNTGLYRATFTGKVNNSVEPNRIMIVHYPYGLTSESTVEWIKLEHGETGTAYSLAPEDLEG